MKRITISMIAIFTASTSFADSSAYEFIAADRAPATAFCIAAASGDVDGVRKSLRDLRRAPHQKHKTLINATRCNGQIPAAFAKSFGATETFSYLYRFTESRFKDQVPVTGVEELADARRQHGPIQVVVRGQ